MDIQKQYSIFLVNKPGVLANVCRALADRKINIRAMTLVDSSEHGVLRVVVEDGHRTEKALGELNLPLTKTDVLCIEMPNEPGALALAAERLAREHININYGYASTGAPGGRTLVVLKVADIKKADKVLTAAFGKAKTGRELKAKLRAAPGQRR